MPEEIGFDFIGIFNPKASGILIKVCTRPILRDAGSSADYAPLLIWMRSHSCNEDIFF